LLVEKPPGTPLKQIKALLCSIIQQTAIIQQQTHSSSLEVLVASLQGSKTWTSSPSVYQFLDNCIIRFVQKAVKYYEDLVFISEFGSKSDAPSQGRPTSLLFATLVEQWPFIVKSVKEREKLKISQWIARYLGYSKQIGEDEALLAAVRDKLVHDVGDHDCRAALQNAFKEQRKDGFPLEQQIQDQDLRPNSEPLQTSASTLDIEEMLQGPPKEDKDHPGLNRWTQKDIQEAVEDGDVGELAMCFCSGHEEIRKEALVNLHKFIAKLKVANIRTS